MLTDIPLASLDDIRALAADCPAFSPTDVSNIHRRAWAAVALLAFIDAAAIEDEPIETAVRDLMIDLLHLVRHFSVQQDDPERGYQLCKAAEMLYTMELDDEESDDE
ncbi:hypothetical protein [Nissabacter archeti]|uniref:hypothetical protein n=1 Tax=Nissabacter archeti TaxID=1917880 RepID=UPI0009351AEA|nr:hypothetical protein [Nissabacter archeti]